MLTEQEIKLESEKYFKNGIKYGALTEDLINDFGIKLMKSPLFSTADQPCSYEGGLILFLNKTAEYSYRCGKMLDIGDDNLNSLAKVSLLHYIGRCFFFKKVNNEWKLNKGILYEYNDNLMALTTINYTINLCLKYGIKLNDYEYEAIVNVDKESYQDKFYGGIISRLLKIGREMAITKLKMDGK
jgi:hypothetical protein